MAQNSLLEVRRMPPLLAEQGVLRFRVVNLDAWLAAKVEGGAA